MSRTLTPLAPVLTLRALRSDDVAGDDVAGVDVAGVDVAGVDVAGVVEQLNQQLLRASYSIALDPAALRANLLQPNPPTLYPVRWHRHQTFCVWRAGALEGLIDVAVGFDSESAALPDYRPLGLLRFLLLPAEKIRVDEVAKILLDAAVNFWRQHGVGSAKAYHLSTGYPEFQAGFGALPGDWHDHIRLLTAADFRFTERYYALLRPLDNPLEENLPLGGLSLVFRGKNSDRYYQLYHQTDIVGEARMAELQTVSTTHDGAAYPLRIAHLLSLRIHEEWRGRDIGKWFLRRLINDATLQGYQQMLAYLPHRAFIMQNLLIQHGFQEQNYRGYTLERTLTD